MPSVKERIAAVREQRPSVDHTLRMVEHYGKVQGNQQAGAVTYFGFLSFFPVLALAFFVVGYVAKVYDGATSDLVDAIDGVLPGLVGNGDGQVSLSQIQDAAGAVGLIGLAGVLYAGLGWISALRDAMMTLFERPKGLRPGFVPGKLRDLVTLVVIGVVLLASVAVAGVVGFASDFLLDLVGLGSELHWLITLLGVVVGLAANALLFFSMFKLLGEPDVPPRSLWSGAVLGAVLFEVLKQLSTLLLQGTKGQPAFQAFGIALILLVWINYFSRVVLYAGAWAYTTPEARALRPDAEAPVQGPPSPPLGWRDRLAADRAAEQASGRAWVTPFAIGSAATLGLVAAVRSRIMGKAAKRSAKSKK